ncbi:MAG: OsmC family peroxiredoxin [Flavobacteriaceae bacterium TMED42]|nr:MAG: osmotically inducible protein OsmC [Kiritimatiellaceae bacterium TMED266]RPG64350.1 MAG: OsmC family peroxiredoxin [Flavobacteriaceae bacterium TMED42]RPG67879.1 MAG: OsmC family peroxiredoxin [Flavobacteriaceae bacterium TMED42]|tara:strand:- start:224 stop:649 length:426 start_codon:yes stop_codon:yes gene_type:complete
MKVNLNRINQNYLFEVTNDNGHKVLLDNKSKKEGKVEGASPMELLLAALAGCSGIDIIAILNKQKINPTDLKMNVEGERIPNVAPSLFYKIKVNVRLEGDIPAEKAKRAVCLSFDKYCSVAKTLEYSTPIKYSIFLNGAEL